MRISDWSSDVCSSDLLEWGMRAEKNAKTALTEQYRSADQIAGLVAGQCRTCNVIQFPQLEYCVNPDCTAAASQFDQVSLVDEPAAVLTYTADWLSYPPEPPPYLGLRHDKRWVGKE